MNARGMFDFANYDLEKETEEEKQNLFNQILLINKQDKMHEVLEEAFGKKGRKND